MAAPKLVQTSVGRAWLANFDEDDRATAIDLISSLRIVSADTFSQNLRRTLLEMARGSAAPVALVTVRDVGRDACLEDALSLRAGGAGSEDVVSSIVTNAARQLQVEGHDVYPDPTLSTMRDSRIRSVVFVDDYCGSGSTLERYLRVWESHSTIRSWRSYGYLTFDYCVYAAARPGLDKLKHLRPRLERVVQVEPGHDLLSRDMPETDRRKLFGLCRRYGGKQRPALGYGKSGGLFMAVHTVPNTLPAILVQTLGRQQRAWTPLLRRDRGLSPDEQEVIGDQVPEETSTQAVAGLGRARLALNLEQLSAGHRRLMLTVISSMGTGRARVDEIARACLLPTTDVAFGLQLAVGAGLVDEVEMRVTDEGRRELHLVRPRRRRPTVVDRDEPYYPHQLRG